MILLRSLVQPSLAKNYTTTIVVVDTHTKDVKIIELQYLNYWKLPTNKSNYLFDNQSTSITGFYDNTVECNFACDLFLCLK